MASKIRRPPEDEGRGGILGGRGGGGEAPGPAVLVVTLSLWETNCINQIDVCMV